MFRAYIAAAFLALGTYGYAQYKGWSVFASEAREWQRMRAEQQYAGSSGRSGTGSRHK